MSEKPKIKIKEKWKTDTGLYLKIETDYGFKTQVNFNLNVDKARIERDLRAIYEQHHPDNQPKVDPDKDLSDELNW